MRRCTVVKARDLAKEVGKLVENGAKVKTAIRRVSMKYHVDKQMVEFVCIEGYYNLKGDTWGRY